MGARDLSSLPALFCFCGLPFLLTSEEEEEEHGTGWEPVSLLSSSPVVLEEEEEEEVRAKLRASSLCMVRRVARSLPPLTLPRERVEEDEEEELLGSLS